MQGTPSFVIGAGGGGVDVVERVYDRRSKRDRATHHPGVLAVDSDSEALNRLPGDVPTIELTSDEGVVGEVVETYPFLPEETWIPDGDARRQRHVGRYKFDNPAAADFQETREAIGRELYQFSNEITTSITNRSRKYTHSVVIVSSFGGGTGSGIFPILGTVLSHIGTVNDDIDLEVFGVGIVPPLNFDPELESLSAEPFAYLNTYGALRNLSTLLDTDGDQLKLPIYSTVGTAAVDGEYDFRAAVADDGAVFEIDSSPFEAFWLTSSAHGQSERIDLPTGLGPAPSIVAGALDAFDTYKPIQGGQRNREFDTYPLGLLGYAALTVPHEELKAYCRAKSRRSELRTRIDRNERRLKALREDRESLESTLQAGDSKEAATNQVDRIQYRLDADSQTREEFLLETDAADFESALDEIEAERRVQSYYVLLEGINRALSERGIRQSVHSNLEQTYTEVRDHYESSLVNDSSEHYQELGERFRTLEEALTEEITECQQRLETTERRLRDSLPPVHEVLTSEREQLQKQVQTLQSDRERVTAAREHWESFREKERIVENRTTDCRERMHNRLERVEDEISHLRRQHDEIADRFRECESELVSYRESLTTPDERGPEFVLPLDHAALSEVTLDEVETHLDSIHDYLEHGLLEVDESEFTTYLERCYEFSRSWPEFIDRHDPAVTVASGSDETLLLYAEQNEPLLSEHSPPVPATDTVRTSSGSDVGFTSLPLRVEIVSISQKGYPESLVGYQWLAEKAADGVFDALNLYDDHRQAFAYPEWYGSDVASGFD